MRRKLEEHLLSYPGVQNGLCLAFSGGVDSAVVLRAACSAGLPVQAVYFSTMLHPAGEREEAGELCRRLGVPFTVITVDELSEAGIDNNPPDRCYRCKRLLFSKLAEFAGRQGIRVLCDGTNADDLHEYRPGLQALRELSVNSPLAELGLQKSQVRALAGEMGLPVSHKPSSPCLATRLEYHTPLRREELLRIGEAESFLKELGFPAVRVRLHRGLARIELPLERLAEFFSRREEVCGRLKALGFRYITLDLEGLRSGSMDIGLKEADPAPSAGAGRGH